MIDLVPSRAGRASRAALLTASLCAALGLAGCGHDRTSGVASVSTTPPPAPENQDWARDQIGQAITLLQQGNADGARKLLIAVLKRQPSDVIARQLVSDIDTDPKILLGPQSFSYTLKEGDTLSSVAQRFLGNPTKFYALARYNAIAVPSAVAPGQVIQVPGKRPAPPAPPKKNVAGTPKRAVPSATPPSAAPKPAQPTTNPALAARLRGQGLAAMNAGAINRAVGLLRQALSLDPTNAVIRADLGRALRIQGTVQAKH